MVSRIANVAGCIGEGRDRGVGMCRDEFINVVIIQCMQAPNEAGILRRIIMIATYDVVLHVRTSHHASYS